jgi:cbb3-type cytochrome oxidase subunit 1
MAHFTDWVIAHVHVGALAWNGFLIFGIIYWLVPRIFQTKLNSNSLANIHFWLGTLGIVLYALPMYVAGFVQASMWKQFNPNGTLVYGNFMETVSEIIPMYWMRAIGGSLYLETENFNKAIELFEKQSKENELAENQYYLALTYKNLNKQTEYKSCLEKAKELYIRQSRMFDSYSNPMDKIYLEDIENEIKNGLQHGI